MWAGSCSLLGWMRTTAVVVGRKVVKAVGIDLGTVVGVLALHHHAVCLRAISCIGIYCATRTRVVHHPILAEQSRESNRQGRRSENGA